jgi:energy-converting hydrogenase Eha subunit C
MVTSLKSNVVCFISCVATMDIWTYAVPFEPVCFSFYLMSFSKNFTVERI